MDITHYVYDLLTTITPTSLPTLYELSKTHADVIMELEHIPKLIKFLKTDFSITVQILKNTIDSRSLKYFNKKTVFFFCEKIAEFLRNSIIYNSRTINKEIVYIVELFTQLLKVDSEKLILLTMHECGFFTLVNALNIDELVALYDAAFFMVLPTKRIHCFMGTKSNRNSYNDLINNSLVEYLDDRNYKNIFYCHTENFTFPMNGKSIPFMEIRRKQFDPQVIIKTKVLFKFKVFPIDFRPALQIHHSLKDELVSIDHQIMKNKKNVPKHLFNFAEIGFKCKLDSGVEVFDSLGLRNVNYKIKEFDLNGYISKKGIVRTKIDPIPSKKITKKIIYSDYDAGVKNDDIVSEKEDKKEGLTPQNAVFLFHQLNEITDENIPLFMSLLEYGYTQPCHRNCDMINSHLSLLLILPEFINVRNETLFYKVSNILVLFCIKRSIASHKCVGSKKINKAIEYYFNRVIVWLKSSNYNYARILFNNVDKKGKLKNHDFVEENSKIGEMELDGCINNDKDYSGEYFIDQKYNKILKTEESSSTKDISDNNQQIIKRRHGKSTGQQDSKTKDGIKREENVYSNKIENSSVEGVEFSKNSESINFANNEIYDIESQDCSFQKYINRKLNNIDNFIVPIEDKMEGLIFNQFDISLTGQDITNSNCNKEGIDEYSIKSSNNSESIQRKKDYLECCFEGDITKSMEENKINSTVKNTTTRTIYHELFQSEESDDLKVQEKGLNNIKNKDSESVFENYYEIRNSINDVTDTKDDNSLNDKM